MSNKKDFRAILLLSAIMILFLTGCGDSVPSASFEANESAQEKALESVEGKTSSNHEDAEKSAKKAKENISNGSKETYNNLVDMATDASNMGAAGLWERFLYRIYVIYYTTCDFAIPIICAGWGLAIFFLLVFQKVPKLQKFGLFGFGFGLTGIMICVLFLPSFITKLGG